MDCITLPKMEIKGRDSDRDSCSTYEDSELILSLKRNKQLHYAPTMEMSPENRVMYYSNIAANTANFRADRTIKKCTDTIAQIEKLQEKNKNVKNASMQITEMMNRLKQL